MGDSSPVGSELSLLVDDLVARGRAAHPGLALDPAVFRAAVLARGIGDPAALLTLRAADLYLSTACAEAVPGAIEAFDALFGAEVERVLSRARVHGLELDDFRQVCREKLFARERPKIADYGGQGDLRAWLRVTLTRTLLDHVKKRRELPGREGNEPLSLPAPDDDAELGYMKAHYRDAFRRAFEHAAAGLDPADRNVLRQHYSLGLGIDDLARVFGIHRATAARRIAKARDALFAGTRLELRRDLGLRPDELDSVMRLIESQVHVTVDRVLGKDLEP